MIQSKTKKKFNKIKSKRNIKLGGKKLYRKRLNKYKKFKNNMIGGAPFDIYFHSNPSNTTITDDNAKAAKQLENTRIDWITKQYNDQNIIGHNLKDAYLKIGTDRLPNLLSINDYNTHSEPSYQFVDMDNQYIRLNTSINNGFTRTDYTAIAAGLNSDHHDINFSKNPQNPQNTLNDIHCEEKSNNKKFRYCDYFLGRQKFNKLKVSNRSKILDKSDKRPWSIACQAINITANQLPQKRILEGNTYIYKRSADMFALLYVNIISTSQDFLMYLNDLLQQLNPQQQRATVLRTVKTEMYKAITGSKASGYWLKLIKETIPANRGKSKPEPLQRVFSTEFENIYEKFVQWTENNHTYTENVWDQLTLPNNETINVEPKNNRIEWLIGGVYTGPSENNYGDALKQMFKYHFKDKLSDKHVWLRTINMDAFIFLENVIHEIRRIQGNQGNNITNETDAVKNNARNAPRIYGRPNYNIVKAGTPPNTRYSFDIDNLLKIYQDLYFDIRDNFDRYFRFSINYTEELDMTQCSLTHVNGTGPRKPPQLKINYTYNYNGNFTGYTYIRCRNSNGGATASTAFI